MRIILPGFLILGLTLPFAASAVTLGTIPGGGDIGIPDSPAHNVGDLAGVVANIVAWVYYIFFVIAALFILLTAFNYLTAAGDPEKIKTAHKQLIYAAISIAIALLAVGISVIIRNFLSPGGSNAGITNGYNAAPQSQSDTLRTGPMYDYGTPRGSAPPPTYQAPTSPNSRTSIPSQTPGSVQAP